MKRATMTLPDDLAEAVDNYVQSQDAPPSLTKLLQVALRHYLEERGFLRTRKTLQLSVAKRGSGKKNTSQDHDRYFSESQE